MSIISKLIGLNTDEAEVCGINLDPALYQKSAARTFIYFIFKDLFYKRIKIFSADSLSPLDILLYIYSYRRMKICGADFNTPKSGDEPI